MNNETEIRNMDESCWNSIGVWGKAGDSERCPKLAEMTHCRNCPVFIDAGSDLLNRELPPGYIEEWTDIIAREKDSHAANNISVIIFRIGREYLALRSSNFKEVVNMRKIHRIPNRSNEVLLGMTNIRGELQLCFSLKALIDSTDSGGTDGAQVSDAKMLVIQNSGKYWVFPVDQVLGVFRCDDSNAQNVPVTVSKASGTFTQKVLIHDQREVGLMDDELLIYTLQRRIS